MALKEATISLDFGQGVDTKTDPKMVVPAKLLLLQNAVFTKAKSLIKRNGYDKMTNAVVGGGTWSSPTMIKSYRNELVIAATVSGATGQGLLSYSETLGAWSYRGKYLSIGVSKQEIASHDPAGPTPFGGTLNSSCAISGDIQFYVYETGSKIYIAAIDAETGMHLETEANSLLVSPGTLPKAVLLGTSTLGVLYRDNSLNLLLSVVTVTSGGGVSIGAPTTIGASVSTYDAQTTSTGLVISYRTSGGGTVFLATTDTTGAVTHTANVTSAGLATAISLNVAQTGHIWVYWADRTSSSSEPLYYAVFSSVLGAVLGKTTIATGLNLVTQISSVSISSTQQSVYYSTYRSDSVTPSINIATVSESGTVGSSSVYLNNVDIYSKILTFNSINYMAVMFMSDLSPTGFLIDLTDGKPVAKFLPNKAEGIIGSGTATVQRSSGFINNLIPISSSKILICGGVVSSLTPQENTTITGLVETTLWAVMSMASITFDFDSTEAHQAVTQQDTLVLNGGLVYQYDGAAISELGFSTDPELVGTTSASGGTLGAGQWLYYATYEFTDANGNRHQSSPSIGYLAVFASGSANDVSINVKTLTMTQKSNVNIVLWRTLNDRTIAYRLDSAQNDTTTNFVTFTHTGLITDATIQNNESLYTQGVAILPNIAPPSSMILWTNHNRIWCVDSENPETAIEYSKTAAAGYGIAFSTGLLEMVIDSKNGAITGVQPMDEKTVVIKERGIGYFVGDGANDSGTGSSFSPFQFIPADVGGTGSKSVALFPDGVLFRTSKGIYLLSRGLQVTYFGMGVEDYNAQDITSAVITSNANQIRFLTSSGSSLLFDYVMNQWSTFTNHAGLSADIWDGSYVYVRADGNIYIENETSYLDDTTAYQVVAKTGWLQLNGVQGFQRVRRSAFLGDYSNGLSALHKIQASFAYDYGTTFTTPVPYAFGAALGSDAFQYRERLPQQKCGTVQLLIEEVTTGASGEYVNINSMGFEAGVKQGLQKFSQNQTVG